MLKKSPLPPVPKIDFMIESAGWKKIPGLQPRLKKAVAEATAHLPVKFQFPCRVTLLLTENARVRRLNHDFRGIDRPTNVLSFPQFSPQELVRFGKDQTEIELGDIALAYSYTAKEAKENNKLTKYHVTHLVIHGFLHLFGYDHLVDAEAEKMEKMESKIMLALGLPDPYATTEPTKTNRRSTHRLKK